MSRISEATEGESESRMVVVSRHQQRLHQQQQQEQQRGGSSACSSVRKQLRFSQSGIAPVSSRWPDFGSQELSPLVTPSHPRPMLSEDRLSGINLGQDIETLLYQLSSTKKSPSLFL